MVKNFKDLSEAEILALAISNEETDGRIYADFKARLKDNYPATAQSSRKSLERGSATHLELFNSKSNVRVVAMDLLQTALLMHDNQRQRLSRHR